MMDGDVARESNANDEFDVIGDGERNTSEGGGVAVSVEVDVLANGDEQSISKRPVDEEFSKTAMNGDEDEGQIEHTRIENGEDAGEKSSASTDELLQEYGISLDTKVEEEEEANGEADQTPDKGDIVEEVEVAPTDSKTEEASITLDALSKDQQVESAPEVDVKVDVDVDANGTDEDEQIPEDTPEEATQDIPEEIPKDIEQEDAPKDIEQEEAPKDFEQEAPKDIIEEFSKDTPDPEAETTQDSAVDFSLDTSQDTSHDISQDISLDICVDKVQEPQEEDLDQTPESEQTPAEEDKGTTIEVVLENEPEEEKEEEILDTQAAEEQEETAQTEPEPSTVEDKELTLEAVLDKQPEEEEKEEEKEEKEEEEEAPTPAAEPTPVEEDKSQTIEECLEKEPAADEADQSPVETKAAQDDTDQTTTEDGSSSEQVAELRSPTSPGRPILQRLMSWERAAKEHEPRAPLTRSKSNRLDASKFSKFETSSAHSSDSESSTGSKRHTISGTGRLNMSRFAQFEQASPDNTDSGPRIKRNTGTRSKSLKYGSPTGATSEMCHVCQKRVYPMEKITADSIIYHKTCFRCAECKKCLSLGMYAALNGTVFCKPHFKQNFRLKGNYDFTKSPSTPRQSNGVTEEQSG